MALAPEFFVGGLNAIASCRGGAMYSVSRCRKTLLVDAGVLNRRNQDECFLTENLDIEILVTVFMQSSYTERIPFCQTFST